MALLDVRDVEAHLRSTLDARLAEWGARLTPKLYEDALRFLLGVVYDLALKYKPELGLSFSTYSRKILRLRVADWYRAALKDARYAKDVTLVSLEGLGTGSDDGEQVGFLEKYAGDRDELHRHVRDEYEEVAFNVTLDSLARQAR